jgi:hypothetical protein
MFEKRSPGMNLTIVGSSLVNVPENWRVITTLSILKKKHQLDAATRLKILKKDKKSL